MSKKNHQQAQEFGWSYIHWYSQTGGDWQDAKQQDWFDLRCYAHLQDCWKFLDEESPDSECERLRALVDQARRGEDLDGPKLLWEDIFSHISLENKSKPIRSLEQNVV